MMRNKENELLHVISFGFCYAIHACSLVLLLYLLSWYLLCLLQTDKGDEELCSVYVPTNHLYIGDIFLVNSEEIIRPNLSIREGIGTVVQFS
jgi:hypothetical protein